MTAMQTGYHWLAALSRDDVAEFDGGARACVTSAAPDDRVIVIVVSPGPAPSDSH